MRTPASPRKRDRQGGDAGSASVEIAILGPALLLLVFSIVQGGLWFYAHNLALAAAEEGVTTGAAYGARPDAGIARTRNFLDQQAGDSLTATTISSAGSTPTVVRIAVTGRSLSMLPGVPGIEVTATAVGPVERFTTDGAP